MSPTFIYYYYNIITLIIFGRYCKLKGSGYNVFYKFELNDGFEFSKL